MNEKYGDMNRFLLAVNAYMPINDLTPKSLISTNPPDMVLHYRTKLNPKMQLNALLTMA